MLLGSTSASAHGSEDAMFSRPRVDAAGAAFDYATARLFMRIQDRLRRVLRARDD